MNRRALAIALFLAACGTALLMVYLRRYELEMSGGEPVALLTLVKTVERGAVITEDMLATRSVPVAYVEERSVKAADRSKVVGLPASVALSPQQTLLWTDLAITTEARDLSSLVQPGKRGVTVQASGFNDAPGSALVRPGDYVDLIVTSLDSHEARDQSSAVLLQRVLVLAVGPNTDSVPGSVERIRTTGARGDRPLTLSLSLPEAQLLALALEKGHLSVAVRNVADPVVQPDIPDVNATSLFVGRARKEPPAAANHASSGPVSLGGSR
jgi:pilus assembly protein CpaB